MEATAAAGWDAAGSSAEPVRARPLRRDAERNRQRILAATRSLVAEKGLAISYEEIAQRADVSIGTVYNRFPNKEELFDTLFEDQVGEVVELALRARDIDDPWEALVAFMTGTLALQASNRGLRELVGGTSSHLGLAAHARQRIAPIAAELIQRAQDAGSLRRDIGVADISLVPIMVGAVIDSARRVDPDLWRRALVLVLDGLREGANTPLHVRAPTAREFDQIFGGSPPPIHRPATQPGDE